MVAGDHAGCIKRGHDAHIGAGGGDPAHEPGEEVLIVALKHLTADELPQKRGHEDREALDPAALVEKAESCAGHPGGGRVGEGVVTSMHLLDLRQLGLKMLNSLMRAQIVNDPAQSLQTVDIDTDTTNFTGLGAEPTTDVRGGDDLGHRHRGLVPVKTDRGGCSRH